MSRDPHKLTVFVLADELVLEIYRCTTRFPSEERFGLQSQIRRAAVSVPTNIVEGCARNFIRDYLHYVNIALASASEVRYLLGLSRRLRCLEPDHAEALEARYGELVRSLQKLFSALRPRSAPEARSPRPEA